jgi:hypothetical protein
MKKKLEADLISIAHRVLQMKNKSDINQLCIETQKLHEKLTILRFVEEHFGGAKPTIGQAEVVAKMKQFFEENHLSEVKPATTKLEIVAEIGIEEETVEEQIDDEEVDEDEMVDDVNSTELEFNETEPDEEGEGDAAIAQEAAKIDEIGFQPAFELDIEDEVEPEVSKKVESIQISFEELLGGDYSDALFVKADPKKDVSSLDFELPKPISIQEEYKEELISENTPDSKVSLNEKPTIGISIGLNDRIAFVKHLFGNSDEDYSRVMNQLITFDSFEEAQNFIEDMVKPDYGDWEGKEDYEQRFIEIIEKKFA